MQKIEVRGEKRELAGKGAARKLRAQGKIPAVLYSAGKSSLLTLNPKDVHRVLHSASGENTLINLKLDGGEGAAERVAILRDFQIDPINGKVLHADLFEISMTEKILVRVQVEITGEVPAGVKEGGVLQHNLREIEIRCLPTLIPDQISVDSSRLAIGEAVHVRDLSVGEGIEIMADPDQAVVSVAAPISEAKLEELLTSGKEVKEPEVVGKGKEEEAAKAEGAKAEGKPEKGAESKPEAKGKEEKKEAKK
jgi:large subunit ribosomal protein L25